MFCWHHWIHSGGSNRKIRKKYQNTRFKTMFWRKLPYVNRLGAMYKIVHCTDNTIFMTVSYIQKLTLQLIPPCKTYFNRNEFLKTFLSLSFLHLQWYIFMYKKYLFFHILSWLFWACKRNSFYLFKKILKSRIKSTSCVKIGKFVTIFCSL